MDTVEHLVSLESYLSQASFTRPQFTAPSAWADHASFAFWLIPAHRPRTLVELGTHGGYSYFAFCQAVQESGLDTRCYAVDTWKGDEHAGFYGEEFFNRVDDHNQAHYAEFSRLVRSTFDEAAKHFSDGSIDLLHIDGRHFYEDVKHDFEAWRPKLSDRAVVLFHDINVRERHFGVFRLWEELRGQYPSFEFVHGHGLGVLGYGAHLPQQTATFLAACREPEIARRVRMVYAHLGSAFKAEVAAQQRIEYTETLAGERSAALRAEIVKRESEMAAQAQTAEVTAGALRHKLEFAERQYSIAERHLKDAMMQGELQEQRNVALEAEIRRLDAESAAKSHQLAAMEQSTSWRATAPMRTFTRASRLIYGRLRNLLMRLLGAFYRHLPVPDGAKRKAMGALFSSTGSLLRNTNAYQDWQSTPQPSAPPIQETACPAESDFSVAVPFGYATTAGTSRLAVICHAFYDNIAPELRRYLRNIPFAFDLFISTDTAEKAAVISSVFQGWDRGAVDVRVAPNRGRDIAPKLLSFRDVYGGYEFVLHIHTKWSKYNDVLVPWRGFLFENLLGSKEIVASIFDAFARQPELGLVAAQHFEHVRTWINWGGNFDRAAALAGRMGVALSPDRLHDFPSGSMFWARTAALKPLLDLNLTLDDFEPEKGQIDATLAHAIERLYYIVCERAGFRWMKIARPQLFTEKATIVAIETPDGLGRFLSERAHRLLGQGAPKPRAVAPEPVLPAPELIAWLQDRALGITETINPATRVSIGIVTYNNSQQQLDRVIGSSHRALRRAGVSGDNAVLVLENGEPGLAPAKDIVILPPVGNVGFGAGHNRLMREAFARGADVYIAANPDGEFHPDAVAALLQMMQANDHRALIEAVQFPVEHPRVYDRLTMETGWASGACLVIPRALYEAAKGFDDIFFMYCEDVDLSWRARALGFAVLTCPRALFLHAVRDRGTNPAVLRMILNSCLLLARKWGGDVLARERELAELGFAPPETSVEPVPLGWRRLADFNHRHTFAEARW